MAKNKTIQVEGREITVISQQEEDYISLPIWLVIEII